MKQFDFNLDISSVFYNIKAHSLDAVDDNIRIPAQQYNILHVRVTKIVLPRNVNCTLKMTMCWAKYSRSRAKDASSDSVLKVTTDKSNN